MKNKKVGIWAVIMAVVVLFISASSPIIDRISPFICETVSYVRVPKETQQYVNVEIIDPKDGKKENYKVKEITGDDLNRKYIKIDHKGQFVKTIDYGSERELLKIKK